MQYSRIIILYCWVPVTKKLASIYAGLDMVAYQSAVLQDKYFFQLLLIKQIKLKSFM